VNEKESFDPILYFLPFPGVSTDHDIPGRGRFFGTEDTPESQPNIEMLGGGRVG